MELCSKNVIEESNSNVNKSEKIFNDGRNDKNALSSQIDVSLCTQQKLNLSSWGLPERILKFYNGKGITHMFKWQLECLTLGRVLDAGNLVYSAPTSAGKTLVAEILISKTIFESQKKALVILPFVSVVREKMFYFQEMFASNGIHVEGYMGGHSPSISFKQVHLAVCTIEKANSIINKLLEEQNLHNLGLVVVDELHLLGDPYRGYLLELLLTKLKYISLKSDYKIQIVGMSATLPNLKSLADWLNADLYFTDFRPVPLNEKLKCGNVLYDKKLSKISDFIPLTTEMTDDSENIGQLCLETIGNGHSILIFCPTKIWCENLAEKIALFFRKNGCSKSAETEGTPGWILRRELNLKKINEVIEHLKMCPVGLDKDLHKTVAYGVAFHHAGLTLDERDIIEGSFRKGSIRVLCATSTLSSGVNLPARRVIIRSPMSFGGLMDILTYRQMIGRAGRMGVDSEGESILICKPNEKSLCQTLMSSSLKPIESCLGHGRLSGSLKRALLEIIASGVASSPEEVKKYADCTFLAYSSKHDIEDPIQSCIEFLEENEFIRLQENGVVYVPTPLAKACLASSLPPDEGLALFRELQRARRCFVLDTDLHIIYQVTPYSVSEQWNKVDWLNVLNILEGLPASMKRVGEMVGVEESFLVRVVKGTLNPNAPENRNKLSIHRRFYTSLALQDLVNETPLSEVSEKYDCNKGMLQSLQQSAATYAGMVTEFTRCLGWNSVELIFSQFQERLQFGIQRELCELMRLPLLNAMRARALFSAGFTSLSALANASTTEIENVFFGMAPFQSKKEIAGETTYDKEQRNKLEAVWITGKADLTIREAAELLITESRNILEVELGLENVKWGKRTADISVLNRTHSSKTGCSVIDTLVSQESQDEIKSSKRSVESVHNSSDERAELTKNESFQKEALAAAENCLHDNNSSSENIVELNNFENGETEKRNNCIDLNVPDDQRQKLSEIKNVPEEPNENVEIKKSSSYRNDSEELEEELSPVVKVGNNEVDYFASSFNFDIVPASGSAIHDLCEAANPNENDKDVDFIISESDSNCSVEILYESIIHNVTKNLSFSRLSDDMFEMSRRVNESIKNMSTPIAPHGVKNLAESESSKGRLAETRSPDLFSQSLTFDTQMGKILDFEERSADEKPHVINPSSSINSDDLGFVSDLSPPKQRKIQGDEKPEERTDKNIELHEAGITASFLENGFKTFVEEKKEDTTIERGKRKVSVVDSPDLIVDSNKSENLHPSKRVKYGGTEDKFVLSRFSEKGNESDDEIMPTPKIDKIQLSNISKMNRLRNSSVRKSQSTLRRSSQKTKVPKNQSTVSVNGVGETCINSCTPKNASRTKVSKPKHCKLEKLKWDKINVIDVCSGKEEFRFFCEQLKEQNIVGLALGCGKKTEEKKNSIGIKIKRRKVENVKEKTSKCVHDDIILDGVAFYWKDNDVYYMSLDDGDVKLVDKINVLRSLNGKEISLRIYDVKENIKMLHRCTSVLLSSSFQDPKVAYWLLAESWKEKNFSTIALECIPAGKTLVSQMGTIVGYSSPGLLIKSSTPPKTRACLEAFLTYHVINEQLSLLLGKGLQKAFELSEMPVMLCLAEMELTGFRICRSRLMNILDKLDKAKVILEEKAYSLAQQKFTISSAASVSKVLSKVLCLEGENIALTKKRKLPSTSKQALQELAEDTKHPLPEVILQWRKIRSISTKFVSPLLQISMDSTKVFGISQTFTVTGRISMHEPNVQNIPKNFSVFCDEKEPVWINLREVFIPSEDCVLMSVDYCQIELRMLAHLSQDSDLIRNITDSSDIFVNIAATVFGVPNYEVDENLRQRAKQVCYGMIYGIGPKNLAQQLQIVEEDAIEMIDSFKNKYQGVKNFLEKTITDCRKNGYVTTLYNRRRYVPAINDSNQIIRSEGERQAVNTTIQGSAADLVKTAMVLIREKTNGLDMNVRLVLHLHDELIFEVGKDALETVASILKETMENAVDLSVPIPVKIKTGCSWGQLENFEI